MLNNHRGGMEQTASETGIISNMAAPRWRKRRSTKLSRCSSATNTMLELRQNDSQMENRQLQGKWTTNRARKLRWRRRQREGEDNAKETKHT
ncbi:hypothetical protein JHK86_000604 [Glycine max]|nr:hypothetical protein JHK86_000604 [Glycine max]